jgi:micrococcal nuclease
MFAALACMVVSYPAEVVRVVDGDTVELRLDLGFGMQVQDKARLWGINAPESYTLAGPASTAHLRTLAPVGSRITVQPKGTTGRDKYGRLLLVLRDGQCLNINAAMVQAGHAVEAM